MANQADADRPPVAWPCRFETDGIHFEEPPLAVLVRKGVGRPFQVLVNERAFEQLRAAPVFGGGCGLLFGEFCEDPHPEEFVLVEAVLPAGGGPLDPTIRQRLEEEGARRHTGLRLVGWYRCRQGGVVLTPDEAVFHQDHFVRPYQVALLFDPETRDCGVFCWDTPIAPGTGKLSRRRGFFLYAPSSPFYTLVRGAESPVPDFRRELTASDGTTWQYEARPFRCSLAERPGQFIGGPARESATGEKAEPPLTPERR